jgi:transposase
VTYTSRFVGIDISKSAFDICVLPDGRSARFANTAAGIADFIAFIGQLDRVERLVLEPTGGYERLVVSALLATQLPVAKVNAQQVRQFARACGQLSKTDRIDAFVLADYGRRMETKVLVPSSPGQAMLVDLVSRYRQLSHMIVQEKNRREKLIRQPDSRTRAWVEETLQFLLCQRQSVIDAMTDCLKANADIKSEADVLMSLKGIGLRTACFLIAGLPELGLMDKAQIQAGRGCPAQSGQRPDARKADDRRGAKAGPGRALHRGPAGNPFRPGHEGTLPTPQGEGKAGKGRTRRRHAKDDRHSQCQNARS